MGASTLAMEWKAFVLKRCHIDPDFTLIQCGNRIGPAISRTARIDNRCFSVCVQIWNVRMPENDQRSAGIDALFAQSSVIMFIFYII